MVARETPIILAIVATEIAGSRNIALALAILFASALGLPPFRRRGFAGGASAGADAYASPVLDVLL
jgi:hypothetical protein